MDFCYFLFFCLLSTASPVPRSLFGLVFMFFGSVWKFRTRGEECWEATARSPSSLPAPRLPLSTSAEAEASTLALLLGLAKMLSALRSPFSILRTRDAVIYDYCICIRKKLKGPNPAVLKTFFKAGFKTNFFLVFIYFCICIDVFISIRDRYHYEFYT